MRDEMACREERKIGDCRGDHAGQAGLDYAIEVVTVSSRYSQHMSRLRRKATLHCVGYLSVSLRNTSWELRSTQLC